MKIITYKVESVKPTDQNQYEDFCDILNIPSLKYGTADFITGKHGEITKGELNKELKISASFYDLKYECWRHGVLLLNRDGKIFAECVFN